MKPIILLSVLLLSGINSQIINQDLQAHLNSFKIATDIELAKNTPEDRLLHFITPIIPSFKNEIIEQTYLVITKDPDQYPLIEFNPIIDSMHSMHHCSQTQLNEPFACILQTFDNQFTFTEERLIIFGATDSINIIDSLSNTKHDLKQRFQSNIHLIKVSDYWLINSNKFNDYKHDIDLNIYIVYKFKSSESLYYTNYLCNFYPHNYWDPDYLLYDRDNNFISGIYPLVYRNDIIFNFDASIKKTDKQELVYGLSKTSVKLTWTVQNDFNLCNINYFVLSYSNDYDNRYSKHYNQPNIYNDTRMMLKICSTDYNNKYDYFNQECKSTTLINENKPSICDMDSNLNCQLNVTLNTFQCSVTLSNISFATKYRFYIKAITKANEDIWSLKSVSAFSDITVPYKAISVKINLVKTVDEIPIINLLVPPFTQTNGDISKVFIYLINHGNDGSYNLVENMYPRLFDPKNQNDLQNFVQNVNKNPFCSFSTALDEPCRLEFNSYVQNKNLVITNLVTDQIRKDFSQSVISQCSFIQMNSTYQLVFIFEIDYFVGSFNGATTKVDYSNSVFFAANPLGPINPSNQMNNINKLFYNTENTVAIRNTKFECLSNVSGSTSNGKIAALATFMTLSFIINIVLVVYIFRSKIKAIVYMV